MADKKPTTEEILAKLRRQDSSGDGEGQSSAPQAQEASASEDDSASAAEPAAEKPKAAAKKPTSTADILAAARAQKNSGGGSEVPAAEGTPPKAAAAKSSSTSDILAAARAQGGGAAKAKPAGEKPPAGAKPASAAKKTAPAAGERPSVAEMVKAAREGKPLSEATPAPPKPKLPTKPPLPKKKPAGEPDRRSFLAAAITTVCTAYYLAWGVLAAIGGIWSLAAARFMMPNMIVEPPTRFKIGPPTDYPLGTVSTKWKAERGIWVVHTDSYEGRNLLYALISVCTHLGCTPNWLEGEQKFKCPCHGSGFYINGINFEGPAPRPLERAGVRLAEDGSLEVDKSVKFQEELGQWQDPASYVELS